MTPPRQTRSAVKGKAPAHRAAGRSRVAVVYTRPETVLEDIARAMHLAEYREHLVPDIPTLLKVNVSWQRFYPACSTTPWQLEGVIQALQASGYRDLIAAHNSTVVVDSRVGEVANKQRPVADKYGVRTMHLEDPPVRWVRYAPKFKPLVLDRIFPQGIFIPDILVGKNIVHLPTMKTHVFTTTTGAMKNAFGGLLQHHRHWTHPVIHETLVDLLMIQREIHPGIFAVMDGTLAGDGPGPRAMRAHVKNVVLASADQVAIDAVAARMMGFDPLSLKFIRLAHERGLGCGDPGQIEVVGEDVSGVNWRFSSTEETLFSRLQKLVYWGALKPTEKLIERTPLIRLGYLASDLYFNKYWYLLVGRKRVREALNTEWGRLFQSY